MMRLNTEGQFTSGEWCNDKDSSGTGLTVQWCQNGSVDGPWRYIEEKKQMYHTSLRKCLALEPQSGRPILRTCDSNNAYHKWVWKMIRPYWAKS